MYDVIEKFKGYKIKKDIKDLGPSELYKFLRGNSKICPKCNKEMNLYGFWDNDSKDIMLYCKKCTADIKKDEAIKIVLNLLKKEKLL